MKLLKFLTIFALVLLPFGEILRIDIGHDIAIRLLDVVVGIDAFVFILFLLFRKKTLKPFIWQLLLFPLIGVFSLLLNLNWLKPIELAISLLYLLRWVSYAALLPIVLQFNESFKKKLVIFLFIDGLLVVVLGYLQYFFYQSLTNLYYLGWDQHMHRIFSVFLDPNFAGVFLVLYFILTAGTIHFHHKKKKVRDAVILSVLSLIILIAIFLTFSRDAILMLLVSSIVFLIILKRKKIIFLLIAAVLLFTLIDSPKFYDENMNLFRLNSSIARLNNYSQALRIIEDRPLLGVGFDSYRYAKRSYGMNEDWVPAPSHADAGVDNSILFVLATTGMVGFAAYGWLWGSILSKLYKDYLKYKNTMPLVAIASCIGLFVSSLFINSLFFPAIMFWMWIVIGLMEFND